MKLAKFAIADARMERSPGQDDEVYTANMVDQRHGGPVTIGFGSYGPGASLTETMQVHDTMVVLSGGLTVTSEDGTVSAGPGEVVYMPKATEVTIVAHEGGATTAYVTYPHWQQPDGA